MKKPSRRETSNVQASQNARKDKRDGRWEFTSSGSLISLGAVDAVRRAVYRTATGEMRFLPL